MITYDIISGKPIADMSTINKEFQQKYIRFLLLVRLYKDNDKIMGHLPQSAHP